jgi:prepilin-type N-terminal cleavage/methylation domain-containing protein
MTHKLDHISPQGVTRDRSKKLTCQRRVPHRAKSAGFTLVEVILAIGILAIMMTINYRILKGITQAKKLIEDRREGMYIANSVITRLTREIQLAVKEPILPKCSTISASNPGGALDDESGGDPSNPGTSPFLLGKSGINGTSLTFLAKEAGQYVPDGGTHSGIVQITYRIENDPQQQGVENAGLALVREEIPKIKPMTKACNAVLVFPITTNLVSLQFRYFDPRQRAWTDVWDTQRVGRLPEMVQFTISLRSPAGEIQTYSSTVRINSA